MNDLRRGWKVTTHDLRPPVQGGAPLWEATKPLPVTLGPVQLDTSRRTYAPGLHYCATLAGALRIAGLWPDGRPSRVFLILASKDAIERDDKRRASSLTVEREATPQEIEEAIRELSVPLGVHRDRMVAEQIAWREAFARPLRDADAVERHLRAALEARGLSVWGLKRFDTAGTAGREAGVGGDAHASWDTSDARDGVWGDWEAWEVRNAWGPEYAWCAQTAWCARDARNALTVCYASLQGWISQTPDLLTVEIRDAYRCGLGVAMPVAPATLGWAMVDGAVGMREEQAE